MTLKNHPNQYKVYPRCPHCKIGFLNVVTHAKIQTQKRTCYCKGIHFPHKKGLFLSKEEFCEHALVDLTFEGSRVREMGPEDECPF